MRYRRLPNIDLNFYDAIIYYILHPYEINRSQSNLIRVFHTHIIRGRIGLYQIKSRKSKSIVYNKFSHISNTMKLIWCDTTQDLLFLNKVMYSHDNLLY